MLYDVLDLKGKKLSDPQSGLKNISGPVYLFIGGLFHLTGTANGDSFKHFLGTLSSEGKEKAQAFYLQEKVPTTWEEKCYDIYRFEKEGKISPAVVELAQAIFLPADIMKRLFPAPNTQAFEQALQDLRNHFSRITLMGYSSGTSILRQMEVCAVNELEKAGLADDQIKSIIQCGVALDIGPTYSLPKTQKTLTHLVTVRRDDTMTNKVGEITGGYAYPDPKGSAVTAKEINNSLILVPEIGSSTVHSVSYDAANPSDRRIYFEDFEDKHSFAMYINKTEMTEFGGRVREIYPSLPTGRLVREFNARAIAASAKAVRDGVPRNGPALLKTFQRVNLSSRRLRRLEKVFGRDERYFKQHIAKDRKPGFQPDLTKEFVKDKKLNP